MKPLFVLMILCASMAGAQINHAKKFQVTFTITYDSVSLGTAAILEDVIRGRNTDTKVDVTVSEIPKPQPTFPYLHTETLGTFPKWPQYRFPTKIDDGLDSTWLRKQK